MHTSKVAMDGTADTGNGGLSLRHAALISGFGLLIMAFTVPFAEFYAFPKLLDPADPAASVDSVRQNSGLFVAGALAHFLAYMMDIVVAWALYELFRPVSRAMSLLTAWFRLVYTVVALAGLFHLLSVFHLVTAGSDASLPPGHLEAQTHLLLSSFRHFWGAGLVIFGIHLVLLAVLILRAPYVPSLVGVLVGIAGLGYFVHELGAFVAPGVDLGFLFFTFFGELIFMLWLLVRGWTLRAPTTP